MRLSRWMLVLIAAALPLAGCSGGTSQACEPCSNVSDCEVGLTCQIFQDANHNEVTLCGDANTDMVCPPR